MLHIIQRALMRVSREEAARHRQRILDVASRAFRAKGFDATSVADVMAAAGMTHGGFYGHFESKADLQAEACAVALAAAAARWSAAVADAPDEALESIVDGYLSERHRDSPAIGCAFAALGVDAARGGDAMRHTFTHGLKARLDLLAGVVPGESRKARRQRAITTMAGLVGALVLARLVADAELSGEILEAVREGLA
jgi:TetR/AcrR family transcriptional regulator, transcriptional repressor for nem operon